MKYLFAATSVIFLMLSVAVYAQTPEYIVTEADVQICFPYVDADGVTIRNWISPAITSITYSAEPVGEHQPKAKVGPLTWECLVQEDEPDLGKVIIDMNLSGLPAPNRRTMEIRIRVRTPDNSLIGEWCEIAVVKFIGKPGKPANVGLLKDVAFLMRWLLA